MAELNVSILVRLLDQVTGPFRSVTAAARQATSAIEATTKRTEALYRSAANIRQSAEGVSTFADRVGSMLVSPVRMAAEFDASLRRVGARARASTVEFAALERAAKEIGASTEFSSLQAVSALRMTTSAGFGAADSIEVLRRATALAQGAELELGVATQMTADVLNAFRLGAADAARITDVLQAASNSSSSSIVELGAAMAQAAPAAQVLGVGVETTAAMVAMLARTGYQGAAAGGALAQMMRALLKPSTLAKQALAAIGVSLTDKDTKQLKTVDVVLGEMAGKLSKLSEGNQARVVQAVFGGSAPAAVALLDAGTGAIERMATSLRGASGAAEDMAQRTGGDAQGAAEGLTNSLQTLQLTAGQALLPALGQLAESMTVIVGALGEWTSAHPSLTAALMGSVAATYVFSKALAGVLFLVSTLKSAAGFASMTAGIAKFASVLTTTALPATVSFTAALLTNPFVLAAAAIGFLGVAIVRLVNNAGGLDGAWKRLTRLNGVAFALMLPFTALIGSAKLLRDAWDPVTKWFGSVWDSVADGVRGAVREMLKTFAPLFDNPVFNWLGGLATGARRELTDLVRNVREVGQDVSGTFSAPAEDAQSVSTLETQRVETIIEAREASTSTPASSIQERRRGETTRDVRPGVIPPLAPSQVQGSIKIEVLGPGKVTQVRSRGVELDVRAGLATVVP